MSRPAAWILSKAGMKVSCTLSDAEYEALPQVALAGLLHRGVVVTRTVPVTMAEFVEIGGLGGALLERSGK